MVGTTGVEGSGISWVGARDAAKHLLCLGRPRPHNDDPKCHSARLHHLLLRDRLRRNELHNKDLGVLMQEGEALTQKDCLFILRASLSVHFLPNTSMFRSQF